MDKMSRLTKPSVYGITKDERLFNVGLELVITWINRVLFLKLLEAQLLSYHKDDKSFEYLTIDKIKNYDDLNALFFQVLAKEYAERNQDVKEQFSKIPYLNSSLFEPNNLEHDAIFISNLRDDKKLPIFSKTVLKDEKGKRLKGELNTLEYLFAFLTAYDFSSEGTEDIQEESKNLINASVLGLIFEKINGYKDGSFFTPGFITMYMSREAIRRAIVQKFNDAKGWDCDDFDCLYDKIEDRKEANKIVNSFKIVDPAVGSGHFLVSALNEILAIKNDLKILEDRNGKRLKEYQLEVIHDDLIITDDDGDLFVYNPKNKESQRVQEALFHEKQTIIENCLFGVDININSVKICRLRLWIELLKNAYYKNEIELETLPNIDINIKRGNSLISRFPVDSDIKKALEKKNWSIADYLKSVMTYRNAKTKEEKRDMEKIIAEIKNDFRSVMSISDPKKFKLDGYKIEIVKWEQENLFEMSKAGKAKLNKDLKKLKVKAEKLENEIEEIKSNKIYEDAFEWRFEFPEVLSDSGDFVGFDAVIGNPPYIQLQKLLNQDQKFGDLYQNLNYQTFQKTGDIYALFYEKGIGILKENGNLCYITSNKWMRANYGKTLRNFLRNKNPLVLVDLGPNIFSEATVDTNILLLENSLEKMTELKAVTLNKPIDQLKDNDFVTLNKLSEESWIILSPEEQKIKERIEKIGTPLKDWDISINYGIKTGYNEAFIIDGKTKDELIAQDPKSAEIIKPILRGRDIKRYKAEFADLWLINTHNGYKDDNGKYIPPIDINDYPAIKKHLDQYWEKLKKRQDKGITPYNLRNCAYYQEFEKEKIVFQEMVQESSFLYDAKRNYFCNDTGRIITGKNIKFLVSILNSNLFFYAIKYFYAGGGLGSKGVRMKHTFFENFSIPRIPKSHQKPFETLVDYIIFLKSQPDDTQSFYFEQIIDGMVYELYFEEEIKKTGYEIIKYLQDLLQITEQMSDEEKLMIITNTFNQLFSTSHPIKENIERMKNEVEAIRIIEQS